MDDKDQIITRPVSQGDNGFIDGMRVLGMVVAICVTAGLMAVGFLVGVGPFAVILPVSLLILVAPLILGGGP